MKKTTLFFIIAMLLAAFCFAVPGGAFDANDYDGGSYDGDDSYSSSWDDDDDDYSRGGGGKDGGIVAVGVFIVVLVFLAVLGRMQKSTSSSGSGHVRRSSDQGMHITLPDRTNQIEGIIRGHDPDFSSSDFISFAKRVYIDIQMAWCKRDLVPVRVFLHDNLYDATTKQIRAKIEQGVVYHYESMVVNTSYLTSYDKDKQFEYLTIYLNARMIDWQEDEKTGRVLRGDKTTRWDLRYKMKFVRSVGVLTKAGDEQETGHNCPNCAAPLEMTSSGKCKYCDSVVTTGQYSWVLSDIGTIRDDTVDEGVTTD